MYAAIQVGPVVMDTSEKDDVIETELVRALVGPTESSFPLRCVL